MTDQLLNESSTSSKYGIESFIFLQQFSRINCLDTKDILKKPPVKGSFLVKAFLIYAAQVRKILYTWQFGEICHDCKTFLFIKLLYTHLQYVWVLQVEVCLE